MPVSEADKRFQKSQIIDMYRKNETWKKWLVVGIIHYLWALRGTKAYDGARVKYHEICSSIDFGFVFHVGVGDRWVD